MATFKLVSAKASFPVLTNIMPVKTQSVLGVRFPLGAALNSAFLAKGNKFAEDVFTELVKVSKGLVRKFQVNYRLKRDDTFTVTGGPISLQGRLKIIGTGVNGLKVAEINIPAPKASLFKDNVRSAANLDLQNAELVALLGAIKDNCAANDGTKITARPSVKYVTD